MSPKNLISITQLRTDELSGHALAVTSGYIASYVGGASGALSQYINNLSGQMGTLSGVLASQITTNEGGTTVLSFRVPIASGIDVIGCQFGEVVPSNFSVGTLGSTGPTDPLIFSMLTTTNSTGSILEFSAPTPSANYYLNLMVSV